MPSIKKINGHDGKLTINSAELCVTKFEFTGTTKLEETSDTCSEGFMTSTPGLRSGKGAFSATYDGITPPPVEDGDGIVDLLFQHRVGSGLVTALSADFSWVTSRKINNPIPGLVTYDLDFETNGAYAWS